MKIIGQMNSTLTVQMSVSEFSDLTGKESDSNGNFKFAGRWYSIGQLYSHELTIREVWQRLHLLTQNSDELKKAVRQLRAIADVLEPLELVVSPECEQEEAVSNE